MNAITTFPHAQLLLTSSVTILQREEVMAWSTFYQWMGSLCWRRMVKREQEGHFDTLVLCGVVRLVKHARTQKVSIQRRSLSLDAQGAPVWSWVRTSYVPNFTMQSLADSLVWRFRYVLEFAIGALFEDLKKQGITIEEITEGKRLREEGREMEHCVFSYLDDCVRQRYRVFSLKSDTERATLGVYIDAITHQARYDQLRGWDNSLSSKAMKQVAGRLIGEMNVNYS